ncbi:MAG: MAPEG family protein [Pseudomonadales bacterium]|nr:MAPEG family protein [Pseudomonadales bacterium]
MYAHGMIAPVLALVSWTFVMLIWMYATRIPAMGKARIDLVELSRTGASLVLPPEVARVADNYNHLHEQPTIFYALALAAHMAGVVDPISVGFAWSYVVARVVHSMTQATRNVILVRFLVFQAGSFILFVLLIRTLLAL